MNERGLRELIASVKAGRMSRRAFTRKMVGLGLTAPFAAQLLTHAGLAQTAPQTDYKPTKAGGGGALKLLFWQAATLLNPHFAIGTKDQEGSRIFLRAAGGMGPRRQFGAGARRRDPRHREWRGGAGRHVGDLEAQKGRRVARWPAFHRRRCRIQLRIRFRSGDSRDDDRQLSGCDGRKDRSAHRARSVRQADAVLGRPLCRLAAG